MQNYVLRVYHTHHIDADSVSGVIEDIDSGQKASFHKLNELKAMPGDSFLKGLPGFQHRHSLLFSGAGTRQEMML
jgi:hypothetical protein